jgi:hypothetical protein
MRNRFNLLRIGALLSLITLLVPVSSALAASICCKCHPATNLNTTLCLTSQTVSTCSDILTKTSNNANLKGITCESTALDPKTTCQPFSGNGTGVCTLPPTDATTYSTSTSATANAIVPVLNVPIPGVVFATSSAPAERQISVPYLAQYLAGVYRYLMAISVIAAAIMIVFGGFKYILGASIDSIKTGKQTIVDAVVGLFLVFGIYTILSTLNPSTLRLSAVTIPVIQPTIYTVPEGISQTLQQRAVADGYTPDPDIVKALKAASGGTQPQGRAFPNNPFDPRTTLPPDQLDNVLAAIAQKYSVDACILKAIVATGSGRQVNAVGHSEEINSLGSTGRIAFLKSGKTYLGMAFSLTPPLPGSCTGQNAATCQGVLNANTATHNDDVLTTSPPDYGLDWRFAHSFGATQCIIPARGAPGSCSGPNGSNGVTVGGKCFTPAILLTWEGQLECLGLAIKDLTAKNADPCKIFSGYSGDSSDPSCTGDALSKKMANYKSCKGP